MIDSPKSLALRIAAMTLVFVGMLLADLLPADAQPNVELDSLVVQLLYERSGGASPDVSRMPDLGIWDGHPQGRGIPPDETTSAVLIKVKLKSAAEAFYNGKQAEVTISSSDKSFKSSAMPIRDVYVGADHYAYRFFLLNGIACADITIKVKGKNRTLSKELHFKCGE